MHTGKLEVLANAATILVSLLLSAVLVKVFLLPQPVAHPSGPAFRVARGTNIRSTLPGVDWAKNGRTLVLAVSTRCHLCSESAPFFRRITQERPKDVRLVAVLPQPVSDARKYLEEEGVLVDDVRQAPLSSIGVTGTPTLLLVDRDGTVGDVWTGKLPEDGERQVLAALRSKRS